ncbi:AAA domain-containing protein [Tolypothrix sp. VBCCA 56010]|uniref:AAA domain-containing protein n=1 Tax=Tolypothrix sp. VBCCA 56010 TaxID=3137731 RepID=UPI003D7D3609
MNNGKVRANFLKIWKAFLQVEENIAKASQFCVSFLGHNYGGTSRISFEINVASATLDGVYENSLDVENFWERVKQARNEEVKLFETAPTGKNWRNSRQLGSIEQVDPNRCIISVRLERDLADYIVAGRYQLPATGFLFFEAVGNIQQIQRKKKALDDLKNGRSQNSYLGNFLFDASQARSIQKTVQIKPENLLLSSANPGQKAAVEKVLAAEDLVLIQGPPGTGKTTVIAEICYQVALRGGRTLIVSQANLAVDNALSRLVHNPAIRAVRKGKAEKVGEEGQPFLEDRVIGTWLENTATDCENSLAKRLDNVQVLPQLLASSERFTAYLKAEEEFNHKQNKLNQDKANLEANCQKQKTAYKVLIAQKSEVQFLIAGLDNLLDTAPSVNWETPELTNFLPRLKPYTEGNSLVKNFLANVRTAIKYTDEFGFVHPNRGAFGLAVWLREIATEISELRIASSYAQDASAAILEVADSVQVFKQNSTYLNQLQTDYQQFITKQQSLQQTIQNWENRKGEIDLVITAVKEWKSTAYSRLYEILNNCQQSGQLLTNDKVQLPSELLELANSSNLPLVPTYTVNKIDYLPDWVRLRKALSFEVEGGFIDLQGKQYNFGYFLYMSLTEIPMVLSTSDRVQWQEIAEKFINYPRLDTNQRRLIVKNTQQFLSNMQQMYAASWEPNNIESTLNRIAQELLESILTNARKCVLPVKTKTEQQLQHLQSQLNELQRTEINQQQISAAQEQVEIVRKEANIKLSRVTNILQELIRQPNLPEQLRIIAEQYLTNQSYIWEQPQQFSTLVHNWESHTSQLESLILSLEPFTVLESIKNSLDEHLSRLEQETATSIHELEELQKQLCKLEKEIQPLSEDLIAERNWWHTVWQAIPDQLKPDIVSTELFNLDFLRSVKKKFNYWHSQLQNDETYLNRYQHFVEDWIEKLRQPSSGDRNDLRRIYLDNANVIGITCVQAANRDFSEEFKYFDVVIIDEVSKCTPPELLIPALKGKKLVMVGDHRQLPPMLDTSTLSEVAQEIGSTREELQFLEESLFKIQFETANESIKQMLTTQYRMHPTIMGAINQFYNGQLECGILQPNTKRAHNLAGKNIKEHHHLNWVKMPLINEFKESSKGTSFFNIPEIDVIECLCQQINDAWFDKVANGEPKKEIAVITFYGAQLRKIDERLQSELFPSLQIRTGTVDRFQGMERPIVIVSMVRNNSRGDVGFAKKPERVNVAFSRAQELLIIVGCHDLFTQQPGKIGSMYSEVSNIVRLHGGFIDVSSICC